MNFRFGFFFFFLFTIQSVSLESPCTHIPYAENLYSDDRVLMFLLTCHDFVTHLTPHSSFNITTSYTYKNNISIVKICFNVLRAC